MPNKELFRWNPKTNYVGDKPAYKATKGRYVEYRDYKILEEKVEALQKELIKLYMELDRKHDEQR